MVAADTTLRTECRWLPARLRFVAWLAGCAVLVVVLWTVSHAFAPWVRLGVNGTDSLPGLLYLVRKGELPEQSGDVVAFHPPPNRFYPERMFFVKKAVGFPGDRVTRDGTDFYINGKYVATAKVRSHSGAPLSPGPQGVIPAGAYFVWTAHPDSYDSRYEDIGWIPTKRVIGRAVRLF